MATGVCTIDILREKSSEEIRDIYSTGTNKIFTCAIIFIFTWKKFLSNIKYVYKEYL